MSVLRIAADVTIGLAAILAAMAIGVVLGLFAFLLFGWVILIFVGGVSDGAGLAVLLSFLGFGAFFGLAFLAAVWRADEKMSRGLF